VIRLIYATPECGPEEHAAIERIEARWHDLRYYVAKEPRRWVGSVRRVLAARANQGSNSIEGYNISTEDAIAAIQGAPEPTESRYEDWQANLGYRRAMTYVLQLSRDEHFEYSAPLLRSLHFMMTEYSLDAGPGLWRPGPIWVRNDQSGDIVYEAPDSSYVAPLVDELIEWLASNGDAPGIVRAAMAHLNLVLVHPFRDGNGRMARCLQSLVLVQEGSLAREFCSIEEYLGQRRNQDSYYKILADVARGKWSPENDARAWVRYCLHAHYVQAASVLRRVRESEWVSTQIDGLIQQNKLQQRVEAALFDASLGLKVRNASYRATLEGWGEGISNQSATTDLQAMVRAGLLSQHGAKRGTYYEAAQPVLAISAEARKARTPISTSELFLPLEVAPVPPATDQSELFPTATS
jgi:Fic family protein